jgi:predicted MFS family arabinose efflux permease
MPKQGTLSELRQLGPRYWQLWTGTSLSAAGDGLVAVGLPLLALSLTTSPLLIGGLMVVQNLAASAGSLPAGVWADRYDKQKLAVLIELARMCLFAITALLVTTGTVTIAALYGLALLAGIATGAYNITVTSATPQLVQPDRRNTANGFLALADNSSNQFVGQAIGGAAYSLARAIPFLADSVSFVFSALFSALALRGTPAPAQPAAQQPRFGQQLADGLRFFAGHRVLRTVAGSIAILAFAQAAATWLLVIYATRYLHLSHTGFGLFMAAAAAGNILGSLAVGAAGRRLKPGTILLAAATVCGAGYGLMAAVPHLVPAVLGLWAEAVAVPVGSISMLTLRQNIVPSHMLGRINMSYRTCIYGAAALGGVTGSVIATALGVRASMAVAAGLIALLVLVVLTPLTRQLNTYGTPVPAPEPSTAR